jgi:hypothetical protein
MIATKFLLRAGRIVARKELDSDAMDADFLLVAEDTLRQLRDGATTVSMVVWGESFAVGLGSPYAKEIWQMLQEHESTKEARVANQSLSEYLSEDRKDHFYLTNSDDQTELYSLVPHNSGESIKIEAAVCGAVGGSLAGAEVAKRWSFRRFLTGVLPPSLAPLLYYSPSERRLVTESQTKILAALPAILSTGSHSRNRAVFADHFAVVMLNDTAIA